MVDPTAGPTDKDTKQIKDQSTGTEEYLEYTKEKETRQEINQFDVGNKQTNTTVVVTIQGQVKTARTKPDDQQS